MRDRSEGIDVTVVGGGLAGMASSIHLARAGCRVLCIEPETTSRDRVGESLDWSAPALLEALGLPMDRLIGEKMATYKRGVTVTLADSTSRHYIPGEWLSRPPYNVELRTLHVDRRQLDDALRTIVLREGVDLAADRVTEVQKEGRRVKALTTASGRKISSPWFIDASGSNSNLFPRAFNLPSIDYGPRKVAMWDYFDVPQSNEGTTLYMDGHPAYMEWIWEIPIHAGVISVGYVAAGDAIKAKRQQGLSLADIFRERLAAIPRLSALLSEESPLSPRTTSFQCRVHQGLAGPNWVVVGEAACMVDPMTSNGVTAALRTAADASALIIRSRTRARLPYIACVLYTRRTVDLARFFNCGIEKTIYDRPVRDRLSVLTAGRIYTVPAWVLNAVYSRLRPGGVFKTLLLGLVLNLFRLAAVVLNAACRRARKVAA